MKAIAIAFAGSALVAGLGLGIAEAPPPQAPAVIEGKDKPILLARVVVTATALPEEER